MLSYDEALKLLRNNNCTYNVIKHCMLVSAKSVEIAKKIKMNGYKVNITLCQVGGLIHDIGRAKVHTVFHGIEGAKILKKHPVLARIAKRHIGGGIDKAEAKVIGLPAWDYLPVTIEEKIVCYADKLVQGEKIMKNANEEYIKLGKRLGKRHPSIKRLKNIEKEIKKLMS